MFNGEEIAIKDMTPIHKKNAVIMLEAKLSDIEYELSSPHLIHSDFVDLENYEKIIKRKIKELEMNYEKENI
jgi:hypothetical protein